MIQGVIFDMDGLMFDTERIWDTCWAPALAKFGLSYKEGLSQASRGMTRSGTCDVLRRFYGDGCPAAGIVEDLGVVFGGACSGGSGLARAAGCAAAHQSQQGSACQQRRKDAFQFHSGYSFRS